MSDDRNFNYEDWKNSQKLKRNGFVTFILGMLTLFAFGTLIYKFVYYFNIGSGSEPLIFIIDHMWIPSTWCVFITLFLVFFNRLCRLGGLGGDYFSQLISLFLFIGILPMMLWGHYQLNINHHYMERVTAKHGYFVCLKDVPIRNTMGTRYIFPSFYYVLTKHSMDCKVVLNDPNFQNLNQYNFQSTVQNVFDAIGTNLMNENPSFHRN